MTRRIRMLLATLAFLHSGGEPAAGDPAGFSRDLPEGVYRVTVEFGGDDVESTTTCKGEARRLFVLAERVPRGGRVSKTFLVDVHRREFAGGRVALKPREEGSANWDERLTLEFLGNPARVGNVSVEPLAVDEAVTRVFVAGDSTRFSRSSVPATSC